MSTERNDHESVFDPGLQPERTLLAWRRTCLAFAVASLIGMRFALPTLGLLTVLAGTLGVGLAALTYSLASAGYERAHRSLHDDDTLPRSGLPILTATAAVLTIGVLCAAYLAVGTSSTHM